MGKEKLLLALRNSTHKKSTKLILTFPILFHPHTSNNNNNNNHTKKKKKCFTSGSGKCLTPPHTHTHFSLFFLLYFPTKKSSTNTNTLIRAKSTDNKPTSRKILGISLIPSSPSTTTTQQHPIL